MCVLYLGGEFDERNNMPQLSKLLRVLVVDDEFIIASTLATILQRNGFDAVFFTEPLEVLKDAEKTTPDLLISDVMMPRITGVDLAMLMRKRYPGCKVLLFSGQAATADLLEAARGKGHNFEVLTKPIHPAEFLRKIKSVTDAPLATA